MFGANVFLMAKFNYRDTAMTISVIISSMMIGARLRTLILLKDLHPRRRKLKAKIKWYEEEKRNKNESNHHSNENKTVDDADDQVSVHESRRSFDDLLGSNVVEKQTNARIELV